MSKPDRFSIATATAVVLASICGSGDAFVVSVAGAGGRMASGRLASAAASAVTPMCSGSPGGGRSTNTMAARAPLTSTSTLLAGGPTRQKSRWMLGSRDDAGVGMRTTRGHRAAAEDATMEGDARADREGGKRDGEVAEARRRRSARPAAVLQFVRRAVEERAGKVGAGARARIANWRRRMSVALIGFAAAFIVMTASAGPAQALFGIGGQKPEAVPQRLTRMPESVYVQREELSEFCQTPQEDRLFDFKDLTVYEQELDGVDMFADNVAPSAGARESFRLKYIRHAEDFLQAEGGLRKNGAYGLMRFAILGTLGLVGVGTVVGSFLWTFRAFLNMAREEEVFLYGEEISVDATEKEEEELDDLDEDFDLDEDDMEDYTVPPSGDGGGSPPPSNPSSSDGDGKDGGSADKDEGDELLDI